MKISNGLEMLEISSNIMEKQDIIYRDDPNRAIAELIDNKAM